MAKRMCGLLVLGMVCGFLVSGCPEVPQEEPNNFILILHGNTVINDTTVVVASNESITFVAKVGGSLVDELTTWRVEEGQVRGVFQGNKYSNTWVNTTGSPITYVITVIGRNSHDVPAEFRVKVMPAATPVPECESNADCGANQHCTSAGVCENNPPPPPECDATHPCGDGQHCHHGTCVDDSVPPECDATHPCGEGQHCTSGGVCENDPPLNPTIELWVEGHQGEGDPTFEADESGEFSLKVFWVATNAVRVDVSGAPNFQGERALENEPGGEPLTLTVGTYTLKAVATGVAETTPDTATVVVVIIPFVPSEPEPLVITAVATSPAAPFCVGDAVTFTVHHTGNGVIHYLLATSTVVGGKTAEADGVTTFTYHWPMPTGGWVESYVWPDDRDSPPDIFVIPTKVDE